MVIRKENSNTSILVLLKNIFALYDSEKLDCQNIGNQT